MKTGRELIFRVFLHGRYLSAVMLRGEVNVGQATLVRGDLRKEKAILIADGELGGGSGLLGARVPTRSMPDEAERARSSGDFRTGAEARRRAHCTGPHPLNPHPSALQAAGSVFPPTLWFPFRSNDGCLSSRAHAQHLPKLVSGATRVATSSRLSARFKISNPVSTLRPMRTSVAAVLLLQAPGSYRCHTAPCPLPYLRHPGYAV